MCIRDRKYIVAGQIVSICNLGLPRGFFVSLCLHEGIALITKLQARRRMNGIVNTAVARAKAAKQSAIVRIHDGIGGKAGNVALPENCLLYTSKRYAITDR